MEIASYVRDLSPRERPSRRATTVVALHSVADLATAILQHGLETV